MCWSPNCDQVHSKIARSGRWLGSNDPNEETGRTDILSKFSMPFYMPLALHYTCPSAFRIFSYFHVALTSESKRSCRPFIHLL